MSSHLTVGTVTSMCAMSRVERDSQLVGLEGNEMSIAHDVIRRQIDTEGPDDPCKALLNLVWTV